MKLSSSSLLLLALAVLGATHLLGETASTATAQQQAAAPYLVSSQHANLNNLHSGLFLVGSTGDILLDIQAGEAFVLRHVWRGTTPYAEAEARFFVTRASGSTEDIVRLAGSTNPDGTIGLVTNEWKVSVRATTPWPA